MAYEAGRVLFSRLFLFLYFYFRRREDESSPAGNIQESVVDGVFQIRFVSSWLFYLEMIDDT